MRHLRTVSLLAYMKTAFQFATTLEYCPFGEPKIDSLLHLRAASNR